MSDEEIWLRMYCAHATTSDNMDCKEIAERASAGLHEYHKVFSKDK